MVKLFRKSIERIADSAPNALFVPATNLSNALHGYPHRIEYAEGGKLIRVHDKSGSLYICRRNRVWLYKKTVAYRIKRLQTVYMLHHVDAEASGAFIDCGSNVGELGAFCKQRGLDYHPFEPEQLEAACCDQNNFGGQPKTNRLALWKKETTLRFYSKPDSGDSSLFEPTEFVSMKEVQATTVDAYCQRKGITEIAVLKIEGEGAEPEILAGAQDSLGFARYVTVDCGFERGVSKASTVVDVVNMLVRRGFELVDWDSGRVTFLFRNTALTKPRA